MAYWTPPSWSGVASSGDFPLPKNRVRLRAAITDRTRVLYIPDNTVLQPGNTFPVRQIIEIPHMEELELLQYLYELAKAKGQSTFLEPA